jgi:hypothetical protein
MAAEEISNLMKSQVKETKRSNSPIEKKSKIESITSKDKKFKNVKRDQEKPCTSSVDLRKKMEIDEDENDDDSEEKDDESDNEDTQDDEDDENENEDN